MLCKKCRKEAEVYMPEHNIALCRTHFIEFFENRVKKAIKKYKMIRPNNKILVAVSGGKDSLSLWLALNRLGYNADGYYLNLGIRTYSNLSLEKIEKFAIRYNLNFYIENLKDKFGATIEEIVFKFKKSACSICGALKRYYINFYAQKYDAVATGHNLDDEVGVLFNNILHWNIEYIARQFPVLETNKTLKRKIKPLVLLSEKDIAIYAFFNEIDYIHQSCPLVKGSTFLKNKHLLNYIENKMPGTKISFYTGFLKNHLLFKQEHQIKLNECRICGYLTTTDICYVCRLKEKIK